jgi:ferrous iron transport protein A
MNDSPTLVDMNTTLDRLAPGQSAVIVNYLDEGIAAKFFELGFLPGQEIRMLRPAPFGDPLALVSGEVMISIRRSEASAVRVELSGYESIA